MHNKHQTLRELGYELRRPEADYLRDGIYELRVRLRGQNYRMLYFFHGSTAAVVSHGLVKEKRVPPREIAQAIGRMNLVTAKSRITHFCFPGVLNMRRPKRVITDLVEILERLYIGNNPERLLSYAECQAEAAIARIIYDLREDAGLTQKQLAKRLGTTSRVIDDLEMADHEGNMLGMLWRIASVLGKEVQVRVIAKQRQHKVARQTQRD